MKIFELASEMNVSNKEIISFLASKDISIKSHLATVTDEIADMVKAELVVDEQSTPASAPVQDTSIVSKITRRRAENPFKPGDLILCKSVSSGKVVYYSTKTDSRYEWSNFGDEVEVDYADLQAMHSGKKSFLFKPIIIILDEELYKLWESELEPVYKDYIGLDYPEKLFEVNDAVFEETLRNAPKPVQDLVKTEASRLVKENKFNSIQKLRIIDDVCKTALLEFI